MSDIKRIQKMLLAYQDNPVCFVYEVIGAVPTEQQVSLLEASTPRGAHVSVRSGHGTGKTTTLAWISLWFITCFPQARIACTAPSSHQLSDVLWPEIALWLSRMPEWFQVQIEKTGDHYYLKDKNNTRTTYIAARTARKENPEALQGFHAQNMMFIIDEASGVHQNIFEAAQGALSTEGARIIMAANPTQTSGYFYDSHHGQRNYWTRLQFNCEESLLVTEDYMREMREKYGHDSDQYRIRVKGDFPNASARQLIPIDLVDNALGKHIPDRDFTFAPVILGVDVAWMGDDRSCVFLRQGLMSKLLGEWQSIDNMTLAGLIGQFEDEYKADAVHIDIGWGAGVIDRLLQMGRHPVGVNFGGKSLSESYFNKRTEMWVLMKEWLQSGGILPDNSDLRADLVGPEYDFTPNGKISLESKKDMKKRGLQSPDLGDGLALTFAQPVVMTKEDFDGASQGTNNNDYNELEHFL